MNIINLIDDLNRRALAGCEVGSITIGLTKIKIAVQLLEDEAEKLRVRCGELERTNQDVTARTRQVVATFKQADAAAKAQNQKPEPKNRRKRE